MSRTQFLLLATVFQGGLFLLGLGLADWQQVALSWRWDLASVARGVVLTIPLTLFLWWALKSGWSPLQQLRKTLVDRFGPILRQCSLVDLLYVSLLAGLSEEVLFRGAIQNLLIGWGILAALVGTNLLFGLCHAASMVYFGYAFLAGCYLTWVAGIPEQNLTPAVITHALYDLVALGVIRSMSAPQAVSASDETEASEGESSDTCLSPQESSDP